MAFNIMELVAERNNVKKGKLASDCSFRSMYWGSAAGL